MYTSQEPLFENMGHQLSVPDSSNRSWVENECSCPRTVNISNDKCTIQIPIPPEAVFQDINSKSVVRIAQMVIAFGMNPKVGRFEFPSGRSPVETFSVSIISTLHKNIRSSVANECYCLRTINISNVNLTTKYLCHHRQCVCVFMYRYGINRSFFQSWMKWL